MNIEQSSERETWKCERTSCTIAMQISYVVGFGEARSLLHIFCWFAGFSAVKKESVILGIGVTGTFTPIKSKELKIKVDFAVK